MVIDMFPVVTPGVIPNIAVAYMDLIRAIHVKQVLDFQDRTPKHRSRAIRRGPSKKEVSEKYLALRIL
jgi:hypothetical protein